MGRIHGRNGRVYMGIASSGTAEPLPFVADWGINFSADKAEVTALGDSNKIYVTGLPDASGDLSFFYDDSTAQSYTAAVDGVARKFYLYPSTLNTGQYFFGTVLIDFNLKGGVAAAVNGTASWNAASTIAKVG